MVTMELMGNTLVEEYCGRIGADVVISAQCGVDGTVNSTKVYSSHFFGSLQEKADIRRIILTCYSFTITCIVDESYAVINFMLPCGILAAASCMVDTTGRRSRQTRAPHQQ